jgi:PGF-CTERM protein
MKSMTKLMVVAMLLVAALVVAPAAARTIEESTGATIYVGEKNLNLNEVFGAGAEEDGISGYLAHFSGKLSDRTVVGTPIKVDNSAEFDLTAAAVGDNVGLWYAFKSSAAIYDGESVGNVFIDKPSRTLRVLLGNEGTTSVDGQTVTRSSSIRFRIDHNLAGLGGDDYGTMQVRVTQPDDSTVDSLGGESLDIELTGQWNQTVAISLEGLPLGTYTAKAVWPTDSADLGDSNSVSFEIVSGAIAIVSNKDTVVRNNPFAVTITGESKTEYWVNITTSGEGPMIGPNQVGVKEITDGGRSARVETTAGGTRTIGLNTSSDTEAKTYTIEVKGPIGLKDSKTDNVKVRVEKGSVSITTSGTNTYYIGEEIKFSGTCTDSETVYLFMTGPNLNNNGVSLTEGAKLSSVTNNDEDSFTNGGIEVDGDDTWSFDWNTVSIGSSLDAGSYTIYAAAEPQGKTNLSGVKYATASINLKAGYITATTSSATVAKGDKLTISGVAQGNPDNVYIWIFGKNFYGEVDSRDLKVYEPSVESDGTFEQELDSSITHNLAAGQYFVIVQHPMGASSGIDWNTPAVGGDGWIGGDGINNVDLTRLQAPAAATALINALDSPNIPDTYVKLTFVVDEPLLTIDPIGTKEAGSKFTITGTTNLAVGNTLIVDVTSAAFQPGEKTDASAFSGTGGSTIIEKGDGMNKWSFEVDATDFKPDEYIVTVESIESDTTATALFNMIVATETTPPVDEVTTPPAGEVTTPPADETPAEPTTPPTPGFGALVALAGLGAVAFLVLRRK